MEHAGLTHVYFGDGKGKTTAAVGLAVRAAGAGKRVLFAQFLKNGRSSELKSLLELKEISLVECKPCLKFFAFMTEQEKQEASVEQHGLFRKAVDRATADCYDLLVLDEVIDAISLGLFDLEELITFLREKPLGLEVALTGHSLPDELKEAADYVTEMKKWKHPYDRGITARVGIDK